MAAININKEQFEQMVGKYMNKKNHNNKKIPTKNHTEITQLLYQAASW